jgi:Ni,Fe-hydrogenase III large subunit
MDYSNTPVARPTLVYGEDVNGMTEARCIQIIKALNAEVKDLGETGVTSTTIEARIAERGAAINEVVKRLDSFTAAA